jgi:hypothetical protein
MIAVIQRVAKCAVKIDDVEYSSIGKGLLVLLGVGPADTEADADALAEKIVHLRIFEDAEGKMNTSLLDTGGQCGRAGAGGAAVRTVRRRGSGKGHHGGHREVRRQDAGRDRQRRAGDHHPGYGLLPQVTA